MTMWGIWCQVDGGITGYRASWLRGEGGAIALFPTQAQAELRAARLAELTGLKGGFTPSGRPIAIASYTARALPMLADR
jgi:hypothetical protein